LNVGGEDELAAVVVDPADAGIAEHVPIQLAATPGHLVDRRLQLHNIHVLHVAHVGQPTGRFAGAQANYQPGFRIIVEHAGENGGAYLGRSVYERIAIAFAVDDKRQAVVASNADARFDSFGFPDQKVTPLRRPAAHSIWI
jgi:hypothetical protein